jgi:hypothetical protein
MRDTIMKQAASNAVFLLGLLFYPEDRSDIPRNLTVA